MKPIITRGHGMVKIWLDDERNPEDPKIQMIFGAEGDEIWAKTATVAINLLKRGDVEFISFDHDLGTADTGHTVAKWIEEQAYLGKIPKLDWIVHSMNAVGAKAITQTMNNAEKFWTTHSS